jgi:hypothetical protein
MSAARRAKDERDEERLRKKILAALRRGIEGW